MTQPDPTAPNIAVWCCEYELSDTAEPESISIPGPGTRAARVLVRLHGEPLGYLAVSLDQGRVDRAELLEKTSSELGVELAAHLASDGVVSKPLAGAPTVPTASADCRNRDVAIGAFTVVVCTRNRSEILGVCLARLAAMSYPDFDVIVVDNAPTDESTRDVVQAAHAKDPRFNYVREPVPGLSFARNRGLSEASGDYVAYTDDDVAVDSRWLFGLARGFRVRNDVACVTGLVCTADITSLAEAFFDARASSWSARCAPDLFDITGAGSRDALYPYSAGIFGTGASFAVTRAVLDKLGGFDVALGAGTIARGGEDLDIFVRVLHAGAAIAYEPSAVVWHHHRADNAALLNQMFAYGAGLTAFLFKFVLQQSTRRDVLVRVPRGVRKIAGVGKRTHGRLNAPERVSVTSVRAPRGAFLWEWAGYFAGPILYLRSRRDSRFRANTQNSAETPLV